MLDRKRRVSPRKRTDKANSFRLIILHLFAQTSDSEYRENILALAFRFNVELTYPHAGGCAFASRQTFAFAMYIEYSRSVRTEERVMRLAVCTVCASLFGTPFATREKHPIVAVTRILTHRGDPNASDIRFPPRKSVKTPPEDAFPLEAFLPLAEKALARWNSQRLPIGEAVNRRERGSEARRQGVES